jgi:hypothetical protein
MSFDIVLELSRCQYSLPELIFLPRCREKFTAALRSAPFHVVMTVQSYYASIQAMRQNKDLEG